MKTFILQLEKFDDLASTREKMRWAKPKRILIVWPKRGKLKFSAADIGSIQHEAVRMGLEIAFVCKNGQIEDIADGLHISVFQSVPLAEKARWMKPSGSFVKPVSREYADLIAKERQKKKSRNLHLNRTARTAAIILAGMAVLSLIVFFVPHATIVVYPELTTKTIQIDVLASPEIYSVNINGNLPARLETIELTKTGSGQSTGKTQLASQYASGEVIFTNFSNQTVTIPAGTIVISNVDPEIKFETQSSYILDAGKTSSPITVKALKAGSNGNVPAEELTAINGELALYLRVTNETPTSGGLDMEAPSPTESDYTKLKSEMLGQLRQEIIARFSQGENRLIEATLDEGAVISETRAVDVGTAADTFTLTINVKFTGLTYSSNDLQKLADQAMLASLDSGARVYGNGVTIAKETKAASNGKEATWVITVIADTGAIIDENEINQKIAGKKIDEAKSIMNSIMVIRQNTEITIFPRGWNWLPWFSNNLQVEAR